MNPITVQALVHASLSKVWDCWTLPEHITKWTFASDDWESPSAENDLRVGGTFKTRMQAKDGSAGFDFSGIYSTVRERALIEYGISDGRRVKVEFVETPEGVRVTETFDPENENPEELQRSGWQSILNNFKKHVE